MKYRLTENSLNYQGKTLYQIEALKDFTAHYKNNRYEVKRGDLGGYIEKEENLSQDGNGWITPTVYVLGNAKVANDAFIDCKARIYGNSRVFGRAWLEDEDKKYDVNISGQAKIYGDAFICDVNLSIEDNAKIYGSAEAIGTTLSMLDNAVFWGGKITNFKAGHIQLYDNAEVRGGWLNDHCEVYGNAVIYGGSVSDNARIYGNAKIYEGSIAGNAQVCGNAEIRCDTYIGGNACVAGEAKIERVEDVMTFSNIGTLALLINEEIEGMQHLTFFRAGDRMQMTVGDRLYDEPARKKVSVKGTVSDEVAIFDNACLCIKEGRIAGRVKIFENACIGGETIGNFRFDDDVKIYGNARVEANCEMSHRAEIWGETVIYGSRVRISDNVKINGAKIEGDVYISDNAQIIGKNIVIGGNVRIKEQARIINNDLSQKIEIVGNEMIAGEALIQSQNDFLQSQIFSFFGENLTACKTENEVEMSYNDNVFSAERIQQALRAYSEYEKVIRLAKTRILGGDE